MELINGVQCIRKVKAYSSKQLDVYNEDGVRLFSQEESDETSSTVKTFSQQEVMARLKALKQSPRIRLAKLIKDFKGILSGKVTEQDKQLLRVIFRQEVLDIINRETGKLNSNPDYKIDLAKVLMVPGVDRKLKQDINRFNPLIQKALVLDMATGKMPPSLYLKVRAGYNSIIGTLQRYVFRIEKTFSESVEVTESFRRTFSTDSEIQGLESLSKLNDFNSIIDFEYHKRLKCMSVSFGYDSLYNKRVEGFKVVKAFQAFKEMTKFYRDDSTVSQLRNKLESKFKCNLTSEGVKVLSLIPMYASGIDVRPYISSLGAISLSDVKSEMKNFNFEVPFKEYLRENGYLKFESKRAFSLKAEGLVETTRHLFSDEDQVEIDGKVIKEIDVNTYLVIDKETGEKAQIELLGTSKRKRSEPKSDEEVISWDSLGKKTNKSQRRKKNGKKKVE